jgi:hypothetical protein
LKQEGRKKHFAEGGKTIAILDPCEVTIGEPRHKGSTQERNAPLLKKLEAEELTEHGVEPSRARTCDLVDEVDTNQRDR